MGTSNWQNIPFCVETLMKIAPQRVLDIGVGFGRWGMIVREFCDVWYGRVLHQDWQVHVEGIEGFTENVAEYHDQFYNEIHVGDARQILPDLLKSGWDVIIFGDVLEHFSKEDGIALLNASLTCSTYVLVNIPLGEDWPQIDIYNNPYERHLSSWNSTEFEQFHLKRAAFFKDYINRPFGSFVLSKTDPKNLAISLFSESTAINFNSLGDGLTPSEQDLLIRAAQNSQELARIKGTLTWQTYEAIDRSLLGKPLRQFMKVMGGPIRRRLTQGRNRNNISKIDPVAVTHPQANGSAAVQPVAVHAAQEIFSAEEKHWLAEMNQAKPQAIAILHPEWLGIRSSTVRLFSTYHFVDDTLDETKAKHIARLLAETGCSRIVFSGFPLSHQHLISWLHKLKPQIKLYILWHGNFLHSVEDYAWSGYQTILSLSQKGLIYKWGFVKKGLAEVIAKRTGIRTGFVMNYVPEIPEKPSDPLPGGPHVGLFSIGSIWKPPYANLAAVTMIPGVRLHLSGVGTRAREFLTSLNFSNFDWQTKPIPQEKMSQKLSQMHVNMNISLTECTPMMPLESLAAGAPCLVSATSHLFEDHSYLKERLIVPYHERAEIIADYLLQAITERDQISEAYRTYAPGYNDQAKAALAEFLEI